MAVEIQVARIPIFLKNVDFLKILNPTEAHLIKPFLKRGAPTNNFKKKGFLVDLKPIRNIKRPKDFKVSPSLIKKIKSLFPDTNGKIFRRIFPVLVNVLMYLYSSGNLQTKKRIINFLTDSHDYSKVVFDPYSFAIFNAPSKTADIFYSPPSISTRDHVVYKRWPYRLNTLKLFFRLCLSYKKEGILLHASCAEIKGQGLVFIGPGNSGKSTVVKMLKPDRTLSDETTVIRKINNTYKIFPNPWWNGGRVSNIKINNPQKPAQLRAIFFIRKSEKTQMRRLTYKESLAMLIYGDRDFQQAGFYNNKIGIKEFYIFSQDLIKAIPAFELNIKRGARFKKDFTVLLKQHFKENE